MVLDIDNPKYYRKKIDELINICEADLITLIEIGFGNHFIGDSKPYILLNFSLGKPIVAELTVIDGKIYYKRALAGKEEYICKGDNWILVPREEIINIYNELYWKYCD